MSNEKNITLKIDDSNKKKMIDFYKGNLSQNQPPYSVFRAIVENGNVTLYNSGKCLFQGTNALDEAKIWLSDSKNKIIQKKEVLKERETIIQYDKHNIIGSDEVGTGDYFGPIVVVAAYVKSCDIAKIKSLGVKDSKGLNDSKILELGPKLVKEVKHEIMLLSNVDYNSNGQYNMNHMKAILHNKVLLTLSKKNSCENHFILIDQFTTEKSYYSYLNNAIKPDVKTCFETKAESISTAVATASVIARYTFLKQMDKLSDEIGIKLPLGAGLKVDEVGKMIYEKYGQEMLKKIAKYNFKTTMKIIP